MTGGPHLSVGEMEEKKKKEKKGKAGGPDWVGKEGKGRKRAVRGRRERMGWRPRLQRKNREINKEKETKRIKGYFLCTENRISRRK